MLRHQFLILLLVLVTVGVNVYLYIAVPKGFFPQQDTGRMMGIVMGDQDVSFDAMNQKVNQFVQLVKLDHVCNAIPLIRLGSGPAGTELEVEPDAWLDLAGERRRVVRQER